MRISVIIPAFNARETLGACLDFIGGDAAEIVVVDDGSTDGTSDYVRTAYPGVRLITQPNRGVSAARNAGMEEAKGDYIAFVDADDRLFPGALQKADAVLGIHAPDILILRSFAGTVEHYPWDGRFREGRDYGVKDIVRQGYMRGSVCGCLFRRGYLERLNLRFPEDIVLGEDQLFLNAAIAGSGTIGFEDIRFYDIYEHPGSSTHRCGNAFFSLFANTLAKAPQMIPDRALCRQVRRSVLLGLTSQAVRTGFPCRRVLSETGLDKELSAPIKAFYPVLYRLMQLKCRFR